MTKSLKISAFSSPYLITVDKTTSLDEIIEKMESANIRHLPVVENDLPIGVVSQRELSLFQDQKFSREITAEDIMIGPPFMVYENTDLREVISTMCEKKFGSCLIQNQDHQITGIFTVIDALRTLNIILDEGNILQKQAEAKG